MVCILAPDQRQVDSAASGHLLRGMPDAEIAELDEPGTVGPPEQAELLDRQKNKAPRGFFACSFRYGVVEDVMNGLTGVMRTGSGIRLSREGSADFGTHIPYEAQN